MDILYKPRLSITEQIHHMKSKNIKFTIITEDEAASYLENSTYYFKIKAYAKLYDKYESTEKRGQYVDLEFAYLYDLSNIDAHFRKSILMIALDIEHYLKATLLREFNKTGDDGYSIVKEFLSLNPDHFEKEFTSNKSGKACSNLINKYENRFAMWNIVEVLSFNDFHELYRQFYIKHGKQLCGKPTGPYTFLINPVRMLRNAAAHNNCLINSLKLPYVSEDKFNNNPEVSSFFGQHGIKNRSLNTNMSKPLVHDFCVMLHLYYQIAPKNAKAHTFYDLRELFENRFKRNKEYYQNKNTTLLSAYDFTKKVINMYCSLLNI